MATDIFSVSHITVLLSEFLTSHMDTIFSYVAAGWPFAIPSLLYLLKCYGPSSLPWFRKQPLHLLGVGQHRYLHYRDSVEEAQYWQAAEQSEKILRSSNARTIPEGVPLVRYYAPKLLPAYRTPVPKDPEAEEYHLSPKVFCKWHRMVYPGQVSLAAVNRNNMRLIYAKRHPSFNEARKQMQYYSNRDRRAIQRISRLLSDEVVFRRDMAHTTHFAEMWTQWLEQRGPDVAIIFTSQVV
ncbi:hypothetical protein NM688_g1604 [Phlebia brevispora]|uniref:Uncharacterized protein n=1 Tax=Phlebia brevispora TaxID=194682 RepID=A0ACC1TAU3_9APHY|nr:hypothetical protein NM688_g1604 [Phlebia brevispora]